MDCKNMFINYENINPGLAPCNAEYIMPYCDIENTPKEYFWYQGDTISLVFDIVGEILLDTDSRIITGIGVLPTLLPEDIPGTTKVFNTSDSKAWILESIVDGKATWKDIPFDPPDFGKAAYVSVRDYLNGKSIKIEIYNKNHQEIILKDINDWLIADSDKPFIKIINITKETERISFDIDEKLSSLLCRGTYYGELKLFDENSNYIQTLIAQEDCKITIK